MKNPHITMHEPFPDTHHDLYSRTLFGVWLYLLSDLILFGALFATYAVLRQSTFGGPSAADLFDLSHAFVQTRKEKNRAIALFGITFLLGIVFVGMELGEMSRLIGSGNSWKRSGFLSGYFTLVGTHGLHMVLLLLWTVIFIFPVWREGFTFTNLRRLTCLKMFWQFLNIVWVFIFSFVYLMGAYR
jgi:cytochrome o ubiquinol oxidase subunit 3